MPKYSISASRVREIEETAYATVEASTSEEAQDLFWELDLDWINRGDEILYYEIDDVSEATD